MLFLTADTHFCHTNVIKYSSRPFEDADHMNWEMVRRWNEVVSPEDTVYHLGDVAFSRKIKADTIEKILKSLNGKKFLVPGNHDYPNPQQYEYAFEILPPYVKLTVDGISYELGHIPPERVDCMGKVCTEVGADYYLHGHVHTAWRRSGNRINVGVDAWNYAPVALEQLIATEDEGYKVDPHLESEK